MIFRRRSTGPLEDMARAQRHWERLLALGDLLDERRFAKDGMCILASGDGFIVTGYALVTDTLETRLAQQTIEITPDMLTAAVARRRAGR
jgi:hypothetical protein